MMPSLDAQAVAAYLAHHPGFFDEHAELLATLKLNSPVSGRVVSLQERQMEVLRGKLHTHERQLAELLRRGHDNTALANRLLEWTRGLLPLPADAALPQTLLTSLQSHFLLPHASLRLWEVAPAHAEAWFAAPVDPAVQEFASGLQHPYCGPDQNFEAATWLQASPASASIALLPLRRQSEAPAFGLLVLGASDAGRFRPDLATDFLDHIAATASAALAGLLA